MTTPTASADIDPPANGPIPSHVRGRLGSIYLVLDGQAEAARDSSYTCDDIVRAACLTRAEAELVASTWPEHVTSPRILEVPITHLSAGNYTHAPS